MYSCLTWGLGALFFVVYTVCSLVGRYLFQVHSLRQHLASVCLLSCSSALSAVVLPFAACLPVPEARSLSSRPPGFPMPRAPLSPRLVDGWDFDTWIRWSFQQCRDGHTPYVSVHSSNHQRCPLVFSGAVLLRVLQRQSWCPGRFRDDPGVLDASEVTLVSRTLSLLSSYCTRLAAHTCRGPAPADPGSSKRGRRRRGSGYNSFN